MLEPEALARGGPESCSTQVDSALLAKTRLGFISPCHWFQNNCITLTTGVNVI